MQTSHVFRRGIWDSVWLSHIPKATCLISRTTEVGHQDGHNWKRISNGGIRYEWIVKYFWTERVSCWETSQWGEKKERREKNHHGLCIRSSGHSWHTFHSPSIARLSSTPRWHFLCYFTLLLSKNRVLTCLILTSSLASPSPCLRAQLTSQNVGSNGYGR